MKSNKVSLRIIYDKILRDPLFIGFDYEYVLDLLVDFYQTTGMPNSFDDAFLMDQDFTDYRYVLPTDFYKETFVEINGMPVRASSDPFGDKYNLIVNSGSGIDITYTTENVVGNPPVQPGDPINQNTFSGEVEFDVSASEYPTLVKQDQRIPIDLVYQIKNNIIYFSRQNGKVTIGYKKLPIDSDPTSSTYMDLMVPDDAMFQRAFKLYCEKEFLKRLWRAGKVERAVYEDVQQEYAWAIGQYEAECRSLTPGEAETIFKLFRGLGTRQNEFNSRFKNLGLK